MVTKMPGFIFSGYDSAVEFADSIISTDQYGYLMMDYLNAHSKKGVSRLAELNQQYNFTDGIPKAFLYVKLDPSLTQT